MSATLDPFLISVVAGTFLLAGTVKGVIGLGLPTVSLALLTATLGLPQAMALLLFPSFVTNVWQALAGGNAMATLRRIWPFLAVATGTVWVGALALSRMDTAVLSGLLGVLLIIYAAINLTGIKVTIPAARERWAGPLAGAVNGILTGMTGSFVFPGVMFLQAIGLPRNMFIQGMGMLFSLSTLALGLALGGGGLLSAELGWISLAAVAPALVGMSVGQRLRLRMSEAAFRGAFFFGLLAMGLYIVLGAFRPG